MQRLLTRLKTIEGLVLGFFLVRLMGITLPPLETWHSWRQSLTNMMARNMVEGPFSLLYPTVDMGGARTGIIGSEFPFFQSIIACCQLVFGEAHWYGRLINLLVCSLATIAFFRLSKRWWNERVAWYATVIFLSSLWFAFSRKSMPDTFSIALVILGIYAFQLYIDTQKWRTLLMGTLLIALGGLCKIPAVLLFGLIIPLWMNREVLLRTKVVLTIATGIASVVISWWYFIWVPYLVKTYEFQLYFPKSLSEGWNEIKPLLGDFSQQFYFGALRSYVVLLPFLLGLIWLFYRLNRLALIGFTTLTAIFLIFALKTGAVFPTHNYYVLPFVPVMAVIAGLGLQRIPPKWAIILLSLIAIEGTMNQISDFRIKDEVRYRLTLEEQVNQLVPEGEKIVIHLGPNPEWMYFYHRKGWSLEPADIQNPETMKRVADQGGKYIVIDKRVWQVELPYKKLGESKDLLVYKTPQ